MTDEQRVISATRDVAAPTARLFELIADPARQPEWDGNDNLAEAAAGQRVRSVGDVFTMTLTIGAVRENHVVEFEEGRLIAWMPAEPGGPPIGQLWRWQLEPLDQGAGGDDAHTRVTHTYDWSKLNDPKRFERARNTTEESLGRSLARLANLAETYVSARNPE